METITKWEDLSPEQFIKTLDLLLRFKNREFGVRELQVRLLIMLSPVWMHYVCERSSSWLYRHILSQIDKMSFCIQYIYDDERYKVLSVENQRLLRKCPPEKIFNEDPEIIVASQFERCVDIDALITKNLIPKVYIRLKQYVGYRFEVNGDIVNTDISVAQYIDAITTMQLLCSEQKEYYLNLLISVLYHRGKYSSSDAQENVVKMSLLPAPVKQAILFNWEGILSWLYTNTKYSVMFSENKRAKKQLLGMNSILFSFVERGYGTIDVVSEMNVINFFEIMYKNMIDAAHQMLEAKMEDKKIAEILNISISNLNKILQ